MTREKVIEGLEMSYRYSNVDEDNTLVPQRLLLDALALLKEQEVATVEPKRDELADETKAWLDKMDAVDALTNIADICIDWDGYRTADGLGGLINEIWAYARYCADRLLKKQEPRVMTLEEVKQHNNQDGCVWFEQPTYNADAVFVIQDEDYTEIISPYILGEPINQYYGYWPNRNYNKTWRCWASRPTDEQREATPWQ